MKAIYEIGFNGLAIIFSISGLIIAYFGLQYFLEPSTKTYGLALTSFGIGVFSLGIAFFSSITSYKSDEKMKTIGEAEIQDSIITLLQIRHTYFEDYRRYFIEYSHLDNNRANIDYRRNRLRDVTEWATYEQIRGLKKAMKFKNYLINEDKGDILLSHKILIENIMKPEHIDFFLINRYPKQLLMGCRILKNNLNNLTVGTDNYEEIFTDLFSDYLLPRGDGEDFLVYVNRNIVAVNDGGRPFQRLTNGS